MGLSFQDAVATKNLDIAKDILALGKQESKGFHLPPDMIMTVAKATNLDIQSIINILTSALQHQPEDKVSALLSHQENGRTPLIQAILNLHPLQLIVFLLGQLTSTSVLNVAKIQDNDGWTVIHHAARLNRLDVLSHILSLLDAPEKQALLSQADKKGRTALHVVVAPDPSFAFFSGFDMARVLLEAGANPLAKDETGLTPTFLASSFSPVTQQSWQGIFVESAHQNKDAIAQEFQRGAAALTKFQAEKETARLEKQAKWKQSLSELVKKREACVEQRRETVGKPNNIFFIFFFFHSS